jgi:HEPN domain-containing protein
VNQADLRRMAEERIKDARALIRGKRWEFAYYAAGYSIECALKSCVLARMIHTAWVFEEKWNARDCLTHDFNELIRLAGLVNERNARRAASAVFDGNWITVEKWKVTSRYASKTEAEARDLFAAITHNPDGVLRWLKNYW